MHEERPSHRRRDKLYISDISGDGRGVRAHLPYEGQDIEFIEDLLERIGSESDALSELWQRPILKVDALGIHGTLFYEFESKRACFPPTKCERDWDPSAINSAQRRLYGQKG